MARPVYKKFARTPTTVNRLVLQCPVEEVPMAKNDAKTPLKSGDVLGFIVEDRKFKK